MEDFLRGYHVTTATWFYLSLLLIVSVYFRFNRIWSVRNFDVALLILLAPGLLLAEAGSALGYVWLFAASGTVLLRLFCDSLLERRPRLEPNLNLPGLSFLAVSAFLLLMAKVVTEPLPEATIATARGGNHLLHMHDASTQMSVGDVYVDQSDGTRVGPASKLFAAPVAAVSKLAAGNGPSGSSAGVVEEVVPRILAVLSHLAVIAGLLQLGRLHFGDVHLGVSMAALYVLLPCTAHDVGRVNHVLPAALILWAFVAYRRPMWAGTLMGLACGTLFFPLFLLPLWAAFYDRRRALQFGMALSVATAVLIGSLVFTSADAHSFTRQIIGSIDWRALQFHGGASAGFWSMYGDVYRIPVFAAFLVILVVLTIWPRRKTLEHLIAHSTAIIVATQFWYPQQGGVYVLWYLPMLLLVVFRPRLSQHVPPGTEPARRLVEQQWGRPKRQMSATGTKTGHLYR